MSNYTKDDARHFCFEFEARIIQASSVSWRKEKGPDGQPLAKPRQFFVNKYSFSSDRMNGVLWEWLEQPTEPVIKNGPCKIRFNALKPCKQMFGFYELNGYPVR